MSNLVHILAIESSCDDTSVAVLRNNEVLSNITANQAIHSSYGGVVPELASRAHDQNISTTYEAALKVADIKPDQIDAIAYTNGPGLLGSLLVGSSFAKGLSIGLSKPLIAVNHMKAHILAHFIDGQNQPELPFLCLTVSGGHTQIVLVKDIYDMEVIGQTKDDAAGEAFDKAAKMLGIPYPGGPLVDKYGKEGDPKRFTFPKANMPNFDYSFSGFKTAVLNFVRKSSDKNPDFIQNNLQDLCASIQNTIVETLFDKLILAAKAHKINQIAIAGGVSANSLLRSKLQKIGEEHSWKTFIPKFEYCTDNAAMIGITAYYDFLKGNFSDLGLVPNARLKLSVED
ncbi:MAG: tRNA (adenosine(37)-N6)-threonylcarbamoyltransferase complex transferase subunit TsaD [Flavobacteriales bacterium]|nr:tRNA (adenosine(37)-N6)-threonylcarbamoyltransferase complex transferase subunit TsaD [Flavobacteriales bacterium]